MLSDQARFGCGQWVWECVDHSLRIAAGFARKRDNRIGVRREVALDTKCYSVQYVSAPRKILSWEIEVIVVVIGSRIWESSLRKRLSPVDANIETPFLGSQESTGSLYDKNACHK